MPRRRAVLRGLLCHALPLTANSLVMSLATLRDTVLISSRLQAAGFAPAAADTLYSAYGNLAMPLYNLVPALLAPVTVSLMPLLGAAVAKGSPSSGREALRAALRLTLLLTIPAALGLAVFAEPLLLLIFGTQSAVSVAAPLLSVLALSLLPVVLVLLFGAALQAMGHTLLPVAAMALGASVKLPAEAILLSLPAVHIYGAPISTLCCNLTILGIEALALAKRLPFAIGTARDLFLPLGAAVLAVGSGAAVYFWLLQRGCSGALALLPALPVVVVTYFLLALRLGALTRADLALLPFGTRLCALLEKCKMLK